MEKIHEFEIRMRKFERNCYLIASLLLFIFSIILKMENLALSGIFFIQPVLVFWFLNLFKDSGMLRLYFLHRAEKYEQTININNEIYALMLILVKATFFRSITWYNVIIVIILGIIFEYLRNLVKVKQNYIIE